MGAADAFDEFGQLGSGEAARRAVDGLDEGAADGNELLAEEPQFEADEVELPQDGFERLGVILAEKRDPSAEDRISE